MKELRNLIDPQPGCTGLQRRPILRILGFALAGLLSNFSFSQQTAHPGSETAADIDPNTATDTVAVDPAATDDEIRKRLEQIYRATGWFSNLLIQVDNGIVVLEGSTWSDEHSEWAETTAGRTEAVVAVINHLDVIDPSPLDFSPAVRQIREIANDAVSALPYVAIAAILLFLTVAATRGALHLSRKALRQRLASQLLRDVVARSIATLVLVTGVYLVLNVSGLTALAATVIGGTGLVGLMLGFAFREIAENFLASVLISVQRPFAMGDLIEVDGRCGFVQRVNLRSTLVMDRDGNHIQIPNAKVYKGTLINFTANPNERQQFAVGIGYDDDIESAQSTAMRILRAHPAVLDDPDPLVLVDALGAATVNLRIYFWVDISRHAPIKVNSSVIRQVKQAFDEYGISMPDEAREVVFPNGVPVQLQEKSDEDRDAVTKPREARTSVEMRPTHRQIDTESEGRLQSDAETIQKQADNARLPEDGSNLIG